VIDRATLFPPNPAAQEFYAPALRGHDSLIRSRRVEADPAFLAAYVAEYARMGYRNRQVLARDLTGVKRQSSFASRTWPTSNTMATELTPIFFVRQCN